jgi:hypothetical protein
MNILLKLITPFNERNKMEHKKNDKTYYTLGGVVTEDTLSYEERRELEIKNEEGNLTDEEGVKLRMDDSISSLRSTTGIYEKDRVKYNPNVEYFMLDYKINEPPRWIRMGYLTQFELIDHIRDFGENFMDCNGFRIHPEKELDMKVKVECKDGEYREFTLRQILFDDRYESYSDSVKDPNSDLLKSIYEGRQPERERRMNQINSNSEPPSHSTLIK